jgi:hypothetical protein
MKDKNGRPWATVSEVKPGSIIECDETFDCLQTGKEYTVYSRPDGLFISCSHGAHYLECQLRDGKFYDGFYFVR